MKNPGQDIAKIEGNALKVGAAAYMFMAVAGIVTFYLTGSDAILLDGMFNVIGSLSMIMALKISGAMQIKTDEFHPLGYAGYESVYVLFKNILVLGMMTISLTSNLTKIVKYALGETIVPIKAGPIFIYVILMVVICFSLNFHFKRENKKIGDLSPMLKTESMATIVNAMISAGAGIAFFVIFSLQGTFLDFLVPIGDALVVIVIVLMGIKEPLMAFKGTLLEVCGYTSVKTQDIKEKIKGAITEHAEVSEVIFTKAGRASYIIVYVDPLDDPIAHKTLAEIRQKIDASLAKHFDYYYFEVVINTQGMEVAMA